MTEKATIDSTEVAESNETRLCPECGTPGVGEYCHNCGEQMEMHLFSVKHYIKEVFHEFAVFDTKFFRTVPALLFKPGFLSREYIAGRRKRYLSPARLYTLVAFVSFFALGYYGRNWIEAELQKDIASHGEFHVQWENLTGKEASHVAEIWLKFIIEVSPYVLLLGSTPIFALSLKILYWKRHILYAEHLVFSFHFYAFSLIVLIGSLFIPSYYWLLIALGLFLMYLYIALKRFYSDRGFPLIARLIGCTVAYFNIAAIAVIVTLLIATLMGYQLGELPHGESILNFTKQP